MKIIDMHCDTISRIYQERTQQKNVNLRTNPFQVDLTKMNSANYLVQNFALFINLGETEDPYQTFQEQFSVFREEMKQHSDLISPITRDVASSGDCVAYCGTSFMCHLHIENCI